MSAERTAGERVLLLRRRGSDRAGRGFRRTGPPSALFTAVREKSRKSWSPSWRKPGSVERRSETIDEDIADLGGVAAAYRPSRFAEWQSGAEIGGFSGRQHFFIAFGQDWGLRRAWRLFGVRCSPILMLRRTSGQQLCGTRTPVRGVRRQTRRDAVSAAG